MVNILADKGEVLSLEVSPMSNRNFQSASTAVFDTDFVAILDSKWVQLGWQSWESDFIIGVGPGHPSIKNWLENPDAYAGDIISETGRAPSVIADLHAKLVDDLSEFARLTLMVNGIECRYKTSGYTSSSYVMPEGDAQAELTGLAESVKATLALLDMPAREAIQKATRTERLALAKAMALAHGEEGYGTHPNQYRFHIPMYCKEQDNLLYYTPFEEDAHAAAPIPDDIRAFLLSKDPTSEMVPVPRCAETEAFFAERQAKQPYFSHSVLISAPEIFEAVGATFELFDFKTDWAFKAEQESAEAAIAALPPVRETSPSAPSLGL